MLDVFRARFRVKSVLAIAVIMLAVGVLFTFKLGSLTPALSQAEVSYINSASSLNKILDKPQYLPHRMSVLAATKLAPSSVSAHRLPSALFAIIFVLLAMFIIRRRYSTRVAFLAGILLVTSSWLLSAGRLALPNIMMLAWVPLVCIMQWMSRTDKQKTAMLLLTLAAGICIYIPSFIFVIIFLLAWQRKQISDIAFENSFFSVICVLLFLVMLLPLEYLLVRSPANILPMLGIPGSVAAAASLGPNLFELIKSIVVTSAAGPVFTVGRLPLFDVFTFVLVVIGVLTLKTRNRVATISLTCMLLFYVLLICSGSINSIILLPLFYFLAAEGIHFLLKNWFSVFPYNPIARPLGTSLLSVSVLLIAFYHLNRYFITWPNVPATRQSFNHSLVK